ncbi:hypothetical protein [Aquitalea pelogenes]|uniref:hypothetical protein n=1 Tax=Aquitalea pelogenes TaxID=1293573 RepID=UPI0035ADA68F
MKYVDRLKYVLYAVKELVMMYFVVWLIFVAFPYVVLSMVNPSYNSIYFHFLNKYHTVGILTLSLIFFSLKSRKY